MALSVPALRSSPRSEMGLRFLAKVRARWWCPSAPGALTFIGVTPLPCSAWGSPFKKSTMTRVLHACACAIHRRPCHCMRVRNPQTWGNNEGSCSTRSLVLASHVSLTGGAKGCPVAHTAPQITHISSLPSARQGHRAVCRRRCPGTPAKWGVCGSARQWLACTGSGPWSGASTRPRSPRSRVVSTKPSLLEGADRRENICRLGESDEQFARRPGACLSVASRRAVRRASVR